ncbi:isocitrate lyase/PEP mutase family protein [Desertibaculum subflavum]|uniref:isocitrate lyase/PEP mutase family protein n=1 Tax=Desertibaculum subflavum TaxID=2268458 RepID=UPI000E66345D
MSSAAAFRERLRRPPILVAPGVFDALGALIAEQAGFEALYLSGASLAYTRLGRPDIGLVSLAELAQAVGQIRERVALPLIVDADTGFGNALNVQRTVSLLEREGASAIQLEDQSSPKRCGHLDGKSLIRTGEMVGKIRAAVDARRSGDTIIVARTDAIAVEGFAAAIERAERYLEAGADVLFVEAPPTRERLAEIGAGLGRRVPVLANMVEGGKTPLAGAAELEAMGFRIVIFPGGLVRTVAKAATEYFAALRRDGSAEATRGRMFDFAGLNGVLGTAAMLEHGAAYDGERFVDVR